MQIEAVISRIPVAPAAINSQSRGIRPRGTRALLPMTGLRLNRLSTDSESGRRSYMAGVDGPAKTLSGKQNVVC
jgi:hypothetical protein